MVWSQWLVEVLRLAQSELDFAAKLNSEHETLNGKENEWKKKENKNVMRLDGFSPPDVWSSWHVSLSTLKECKKINKIKNTMAKCDGEELWWQKQILLVF